MRNGVRLAVEEANHSGGISGRAIDLMIEDDKGTPQGAQEADSRLIQQGAIAIIGHLTSNQSLAGYDLTEKNQIVLFSPTAATSNLTRKKDHFFRLFPTTDFMGSELARYIYNQRSLAKISIILDLDNDSYTVPFANAFEAALVKLGGKVTGKVEYRSSQSPDFSPLVKELIKPDTQGIFIIASSTVAPLIAQQIRLSGWAVPLFAAPWAQGDALIQNGGKAVEGLELILPYDLNDSAPALADFKSRYFKRYNENPTFSALFGYETFQVLLAALNKNGGSAADLAESLEKTGQINGLTGKIQLDAYGDVIRPLYIMAIQNGQFVTKLAMNQP
jgi:branched-chain amino acid transport system substrate-binding protein